jgi:4-amino-4-deoxy-L-arabinose transferase-like glycosyltransferase
VNLRLRTDAILLTGICAFFFFYQLGVFGLVGADEPRYAQVAREMLARHDWVTPVLGGKPWLEKPPLLYWQAMAAYAVFGVADWAARLPSAIDATCMVVVVFLFLKKFRRGSELDGALMVASCAATIGFSRAAATDMPLASTFTIALLAWYGWRESGSRLYLAATYAFLGFGTLAKGPIAVFLAVLVITAFAAITKNWSAPKRPLWWPGVLIYVLVTLPWFVAVQIRNPEFLRVFIFEHNLARFGTDMYHHVQPFWYFLPVSLLGLVPWTVLIAAAFYENVVVLWRERKQGFESEDEYNIFLVLWLVLPIIFFSLSKSKLPGYILPALPAGALLLAEYVRRRLAAEDQLSLVMSAFHGLIAAGILVPAVLVNTIFSQDRKHWVENAPLLAVVWLVFATAIAIVLSRPRGLRYLHFVTLVPVVLAVAALLRMGGPVANARISQRPVAEALTNFAGTQLPVAVVGVPRDKEYGLAFYRNTVVSRYERGEVPPTEHLLVAPDDAQGQVARFIGSRSATFLGTFPAQHIDIYRVAPATPQTEK